MEASDIKKMKDLEDENRWLKQMFADLSLECRAVRHELTSGMQDIVAEQGGISLSAGYAAG